MRRLWLLAGLLTILAIDPLAAQQATEAQREAIRASCRSDFIANCSGVTPGGKDAFECLVRNESRLSGSCKEAVNAVAEKPAEPAAAPAAETPAPARAESAAPKEPAPAAASSEDALKSVQKACTLSDMMAHCSWIQPNNPEIVLCLKANAADLSPSCQAAVQATPATPAAASAPEPERKATPAGAQTGRTGTHQCACPGPGCCRREEANSRATERDPRRLPVRLHCALLRSNAGRRRRFAMPAT